MPLRRSAGLGNGGVLVCVSPRRGERTSTCWTGTEAAAREEALPPVERSSKPSATRPCVGGCGAEKGAVRRLVSLGSGVRWRLESRRRIKLRPSPCRD